MKNPIFDYVRRPDGSSEFEDFLSSIPISDAQKLLAVITKTEEHGLLVAQRIKWVKKLENNLYELRSEVSGNIQRALYFQEIDNKYLITHGFTKKSDKTPEREKQHARNIRDKYNKGELK
ncbi:MAG: type II toxin-antitoxin system RelE/ParE family toxin [Streptococcaceae bacterium]|jgi:phage-related protein|nr:type II toxin-antitoxin system RelE/ParE family toxin [Streptococcaceae bacterium]